MTRILMVLTAADWPEAYACVDSARQNAADPGRLTFGVSLGAEPGPDDLETMHALGASLYLVPGLSPWQDMELLWQGEGCVLAANPAMRFSAGWDRILIRTLNYCQQTVSHRSVLTGCLPREVDPVDAVYPVAAERIDRRSQLHYRRGTPLRYARRPVPSAFLNPEFCFAPATFFRAMAQEKGPLFLSACRCRWDLYTLHRPVIHSAWDTPLQPESIRGCEEMEGTQRFSARFGVDLIRRELSAKAKCGIFTFDMGFDIHVPIATRVQEAMRNLDNHASRLEPLCVTAWLTLPDERLDEQRMLCFRRMSSMKNLPLLCYSDPANAARISLSHGEVQEYRRYYGLDVPNEAMRQDLKNYMKLCKPFMLERSRQNTLTYSHYIWLDFDYLSYPAYEKAALDWENVCRDRIMMSVVDNVPDTSMISVPQDRLEPLCRELTLLVREDLAAKRPLPEEHALWVRLMNRHPDWFELIQLPGPHELLTLTMAVRGEEFHTE